MKRDYNLWRLILRQVCDGTAPPELASYEEQLVVYNSALLVNGGYVEGQAIPNGSGHYVSVALLQLTNEGHDLLEKLEAERKPNTKEELPMPPKLQHTLTIFISHSAKDEGLAKALVELLRNGLNLPANEIRCTSVNGYRLPVGASVEEQLRSEVRQAKAFIGLITPSSIESAYVMFELGARWGAELHLAPLLGAGADSSYLRGPLSSLNALRCDDGAQLHQLIDDLANVLGITDHTPPAAYQSCIDELIAVSKAGAGSGQKRSMSPEVVPTSGVKSLVAEGGEPGSQAASPREMLALEDGVFWSYRNDEKIDGPFCQVCLEKDEKLIHLHNGDNYGGGHRWFCLSCHNGFGGDGAMMSVASG